MNLMFLWKKVLFNEWYKFCRWVWIKRIKDTIPNSFEIKSIDDFEIDGDFVESQAFAYLAIRSFLNLPISFPSTTGCIEPVTGGEIIKNF